MKVIAAITEVLRAFLLINPVHSFVWKMPTPFASTTRSCSNDFSQKRWDKTISSSSSSASTYNRYILPTLSSLPSPPLTNNEIDETDEKARILADVLELASSFGKIQDTIDINSDLYKDQLSAYEMTIRTLEGAINKANYSLELKDSTIDTLKNNLLEVERSVEEGVMERRALVQRMEQMEIDLKKREEEVRAKVLDLDAAVEKQKQFEAESKEIKKQEISQLDEDLANSYVDQIKQMQEEVSSAKDAIREKDAEIATLQKTLMEKEQMVQDGKASTAAMTVRLEEVEGERNKTMKELEAKNEAYVAMEKLLEESKRAVETAESIDEIMVSVREKDAEMATLQKTLMEKEQMVEDGKASAAAMTVRLEEVEGERNKTMKELEAKNEAYITMEILLEESKKSIETAESIDEIMVSVREKDAEIATLQKTLMKKEQMVQDGKASTAAMAACLEEVEGERNKTMKELEAKNEAYLAMETLLEESKKHVENTESTKKISTLETLLQQKENTIADLETKFIEMKKYEQMRVNDANKEQQNLTQKTDKKKEEMISIIGKLKLDNAKEIIELKRKAENEEKKLQLSMDSSLKAKDDLITSLSSKIKFYELERHSLRKLLFLSLERFSLLFNEAY